MPNNAHPSKPTEAGPTEAGPTEAGPTEAGPTEAGGIASAAGAARATLITPGQRPLAAEYDVALLDLDGVVYSGPQAIAGAPAALTRAREAGLRLAFVTNNAS